MNIEISWHGMEKSGAIEGHVLKNITPITKRFSNITKLSIRLQGTEKNGWAPSIQLKACLKGKIITHTRIFCRKEDCSRHDMSDLDGFYTTINKATTRLLSMLEEESDKMNELGRGRRATKLSRAIA
jgi:ribosome-associated translation inhibitor RaiA